MKRWMLSMIGLVVLAGISGCIAVWDIKDLPAANSEIVTVNDRIYVINKKTCEVNEIDLTTAKPFAPKQPKKSAKADSAD